MNQVRAFLCFSLVLFGVSLFGQTNEDNVILESLIKHYYAQRPNDTIFSRKGKIKKINVHYKPNLILINETYPFSVSETYSTIIQKFGLTELDSISLADYHKKNNNTILIDSIKGFKGNIIYKTKSEMKKVFDEGGWNNYGDTFGYKELIRVSRPGINDKKNNAFVCLSRYSGELSGCIVYFLLEKINAKWIVKRSTIVIIS